jgi:phosphoribosyl 1,2-cyclic phosphate phosphodiesterase
MSLTLTFLGTGTSAGVPMIGCDCRVCTSDDPRDRRDRPSVLLRFPDERGRERTLLIDTAPDLRHQMIRHRVSRLDGVLYTHNHADHVFGIDDLRRFNAVMQEPMDIYAERSMLDWLIRTFPYIFAPHKNVNPSFVPDLILHEVAPGEPLELFGRAITPLRLLHGRLPILGYRLGDLAYCTDCSAIPPETYPLLEGLDVLVIDGLRYRHHPTHLTVNQAIEIIDHLAPQRAYLTHMSHEILHAELDPQLPPNVHLSYDGLEVETAL